MLAGKEWRAWSRSKSVPSSTVKAGVLKVTSADLKVWDVSFTPSTPSNESYEAHAALLASGLTSDVKAGENGGHRLTHDFVVTALVKAPTTTKAGQAQGELILNQSAKEKPARLAIAVWVTRAGGLEPLQATGGWLPRAGGKG